MKSGFAKYQPMPYLSNIKIKKKQEWNLGVWSPSDVINKC